MKTTIARISEVNWYEGLGFRESFAKALKSGVVNVSVFEVFCGGLNGAWSRF